MAAERAMHHDDVTDELIEAYKNTPLLWDPLHINYNRKDLRKIELNNLLRIYKKMKPDADIECIKKKINIMRSNYRRELNRFRHDPSKEPTSKTFHAMSFLNKLEQDDKDYERYMVPYHQPPDSPDFRQRNMSPDDYRSRLKRVMENSASQPAKQLETYTITENQGKLNFISHQKRMPIQQTDPQLLLWAKKLNSLPTILRLKTEKAINDILFEAEMNSAVSTTTSSEAIASTPDQIISTEPSTLEVPKYVNYCSSAESDTEFN